MKFTNILATCLAALACIAAARAQPAAKTFIDYFQPMPIQGALRSDVWGAPGVLPRDVKNGLEDTANKYCYWDGQIIKSDDGRYHIYASRWDESQGHRGWGKSVAVHAVSDNLFGPYIDKGLCWPDDERGKGHNVTALRLPDGRYAIVISETRPGTVYVSNSPGGPWEKLGTIVTEGETRKRASNYSVMLRPDGDFMIVPRAGQILISKSGILGPYIAQGPSIYPTIAGLSLKDLEDPVVWFSGGLYHIVVNSWSQRKAFHLTSRDGITGWTYRGLAYDPTIDFVRYTDGTVNRWDKLERPGVVIENGHVVAVSLAVLDVPKEQEHGNDNHGNKIIVIPFDGAALDRDLQNAASATAQPAPGAKRVTISDPALPTPPGPFAPSWDSIRAHYKPPAWLVDGKFGIFIHWGVYTVPAHQSEWYARHMYASTGVIKWHRENFGPQDVFGYKDFIPLFRAERYDPAAWAALFKRAGARYVMPVAEHHDGFAMYDSALTRWDAKDMGPRRDLIGDLAAAVRDAGLVFCLSNHRMEHWDFMYPRDGLKTDLYDPANADFYGPPQPAREVRAAKGEVITGRDAEQSPAFLNEWLRRNQELVDKYRPQMIFFDNGVNARALDDVKLRFAAYYYNRAAEWNLDATITTKRDAYLAGSVKDYERGRPTGIAPEFWQCDTSITHNGWCYTNEIVLRNAGELIRELVDCVSKNGAYLLNIAPRADGVIPDDQQLRLLQIGEWLGVNGEAIYGSRPWRKFGEGPTEEPPTGDRGIINAMLRGYTASDMRFTTRRAADGTITLYAHLFAWPADNTVTITSLAAGSPDRGEIETITLLGSRQRVTFERTAAGLVVKLPPWRPSDHVNVLKITGLKMP